MPVQAFTQILSKRSRPANDDWVRLPRFNLAKTNDNWFSLPRVNFAKLQTAPHPPLQIDTGAQQQNDAST